MHGIAPDAIQSCKRWPPLALFEFDLDENFILIQFFCSRFNRQILSKLSHDSLVPMLFFFSPSRSRARPERRAQTVAHLQETYAEPKLWWRQFSVLNAVERRLVSNELLVQQEVKEKQPRGQRRHGREGADQGPDRIATADQSGSLSQSASRRSETAELGVHRAAGERYRRADGRRAPGHRSGERLGAAERLAAQTIAILQESRADAVTLEIGNGRFPSETESARLRQAIHSKQRSIRR